LQQCLSRCRNYRIGNGNPETVPIDHYVHHSLRHTTRAICSPCSSPVFLFEAVHLFCYFYCSFIAGKTCLPRHWSLVTAFFIAIGGVVEICQTIFASQHNCPGLDLRRFTRPLCHGKSTVPANFWLLYWCYCCRHLYMSILYPYLCDLSPGSILSTWVLWLVCYLVYLFFKNYSFKNIVSSTLNIFYGMFFFIIQVYVCY